MTKVERIVTILLWVLIIISAILIVSLMTNIGEDTDPVMGGWINSNLVWAYILFGICAGIAILSALFHMFTDIKAAKKGLISIVFLGVVALISFLIASDEIPQFVGVQKFINDGTLTAQVAKLVDTGLYATYILLGLAILSILFSSVTRMLK